MDIDKILIWSGSILALCLYVPLIIGILRGKIKQSVATFILWTALDAIALASVVVQKGNYILLMFFTASGLITVGSLLYKRLFSWTRFETLVTALVVICLVVWAASGSMWATVASSSAIFVAGFPQMRDSWREPNLKTGLIYIGYVLVNFSSFLAGKDWSVKERFYYGVTTVLCLIIAIASLRLIKRATV